MTPGGWPAREEVLAPGRLGVQFLYPLRDDLDVRLGHRLAQIPVDNVSAVAVQNAAQVIERPADVDVRDIDVPVLMRGQRLLKARAFLRRLAVPLR
jgi:hypothetical protein